MMGGLIDECASVWGDAKGGKGKTVWGCGVKEYESLTIIIPLTYISALLYSLPHHSFLRSISIFFYVLGILLRESFSLCYELVFLYDKIGIGSL